MKSREQQALNKQGDQEFGRLIAKLNASNNEAVRLADSQVTTEREMQMMASSKPSSGSNPQQMG